MIKKEALFSAFAQNSPDCIKVFDAGEKLVYINKVGLKEHGYGSIAEAARADFANTMFPASQKKFQDAFVAALSDGKTSTIEVEHTKEGSNREFCLETIMPIRGTDGRISGIIGFSRDITEHKQIEKKLENARIAAKNVLEDLQIEKETLTRANAKDEALLASIGDGVIATDRDGSIILMNQAAERMLGWSAEQVIGKLPVETLKILDEKGNIIPEAKRPITLALGGKTTTTTTTNSPYFYTRKNGTNFPVAITATPVKVDNKIIGVIDVFRDIAHEKEIDRAKTEFVSLASHELRTPLTAIDGITAMIREGEYGEVNSNLKQPLEDINTSSERLIHLVDNLLNLARMQAGRLKYGLSEIDIKTIAEGAVSLLQIIAKPKGLKLSTYNIDSVNVLADVDKLEQILDNIIGNALKFTDKGSITVSTHVVGDNVEVYITDTGIGIAKEDQTKLFGRFEQLGSSLGRPAGTGLGLHISRELIRKMGGDLWLEKSEPGVGSTFAFSLPLAKSQLAVKVKKEIARLQLPEQSDGGQEEEARENPDKKAS